MKVEEMASSQQFYRFIYLTIFLGFAAASCGVSPSGAEEPFSLPYSRIHELEYPKSAAPENQEELLTSPSEVPGFDIGPRVRVYLVPSNGVAMIFATSEDYRLRRLINLPSSNIFGSLEQLLVLSHFEIDADRPLKAVMLEYSYHRQRHAAMQDDLRASFLGICVLKHHRLAGNCQTVSVWKPEVGEAEPESDYRFMGAVFNGREPAPWSTACPLTRDHNGDGYQDLVLWRRRWIPARETGEPQLIEDVLWMPFDPETNRFRVAEPFEGLSPTDEACWADRISIEGSEARRAVEGLR